MSDDNAFVEALFRTAKYRPGFPSAGFADLAAARKRPGLAPLALRLVVLTALRSGEVRNARWSWLSFDGTPMQFAVSGPTSAAATFHWPSTSATDPPRRRKST